MRSGLQYDPGPGSAVQHLFVGNDATDGGLSRYALPLQADASADFTLTGNNVVASAFDPAGNMVVASSEGQLAYYPAPISATSAPAVGFLNGSTSANGLVSSVARSKVPSPRLR